MELINTEFDGLFLIKLDKFSDERGFFLESYNKKKYVDLGIHDKFIQDNVSHSSKSILRGLHYQINRPQSQLVTVLYGKIFDVTVDLRQKSPTFCKWFGIELSDDYRYQLYMAPGFAHGFYVLSDHADLHYKVSQNYDPNDEAGLIWCDEDINIHWPEKTPLISSKDAGYPKLKEIMKNNLPKV